MADGIEIKIEGVSAVVTAIEALKSRLDIATRVATTKSGQTLQSKAVSNFRGTHTRVEHHLGGDSPNTVTGNLQRSIITRPTIHIGPGRYQSVVTPTAIYSRVIELGATITPTEKEYLSWIGIRADGSLGRIYKKSVVVPPYPYFIPAYRSTALVMRNIYSTYWGAAFNG